jgi:hypothetical protein
MSDGGRYRHIEIRLWVLPAFRALKPEGKLVALYVLSGPPTNSVGLYRFSLAAASEDLGISVPAVRRQFAAVRAAFGWRYDADARVIWIPEWLQFNVPQSPNVVRGWRTVVAEIPDCPLKVEALDSLRAFIDTKGEGFQKAFQEVFGEGFGEAFGNESGKPPALTPGPGPGPDSERERLRRENSAQTREAVHRLRVAEHVGLRSGS